MQDQLQPPTEPAQETMNIRDICAPLYQAKGWMKLIGILMIVSGALLVLTCFGIVIAWLPIWLGIALVGAASALERAYNEQQGAALVEAMTKLKTYFTVTGILLLIGIVMQLAGFIVMLATGVLAGVMEAAASSMP